MGLPIRRVVIALDDFACRIGQRARAAQRIRQEVGSLSALIAGKALVNARAGQDVVDRIALALLHDVHTVVEIGDGLPALGLADAAAQRVVLEAGLHGVPDLDGDQLVARVPVVGALAVAQQVAVGVVAQGPAVVPGLPVVVVECAPSIHGHAFSQE